MRASTKSTALAAAAAVALVAACSDSGSTPPGSDPAAAPPVEEVAHGPSFPQCGGIDDATVGELTGISGLVNTATNSAGCQWLQNGGVIGPHFSFSWFRGSPIGRERRTQELSRAIVEDISVEGYDGFIALAADPAVTDNTLCEIGIQFDSDFIEWSVSYVSAPHPDPCDVAEELTRQSIVNAQ